VAPNSNPEERKPSFTDHYNSFVLDARNSQFTGGLAPETLNRDSRNNENVELKIEKVDQYRLGLDPASVPASFLGDRCNNGAMSDSDSTRSCSPKATGSESSDGRSVKTASPNRSGGHVNLKKAWLQQYHSNTSTIIPSSSTATSTLTERKLYELGVTASPGSDSLKLLEAQTKAQSIPNGHVQQAAAYLNSPNADKPLSAITPADIPKSCVPDRVYDFDNSSTCSDSSTTSKGRSKRSREPKTSSKKHRDRKKHCGSAERKSAKHSSDNTGRSRPRQGVTPRRRKCPARRMTWMVSRTSQSFQKGKDQ
jgi:hypothetical protein